MIGCYDSLVTPVQSDISISDTSGTGSWTLVAFGDYDTGVSRRQGMSFYYKDFPSSPGAITVTGTGTGQNETSLIIMEVIGGDTATPTNYAFGTNSAGDPTLTLPSGAASTSAAAAVVFAQGNNSFGAVSGYTELYDANPAAQNRRIVLAYDVTSPGSTYNPVSSNTYVLGVIWEIAEAATGAISVFPTGQSVTASVGDVSVVGKAIVPVTGNVATAAVGTANVGGTITVPVTGQSMTASLGTPSLSVSVVVQNPDIGMDGMTLGLGLQSTRFGSTITITGMDEMVAEFGNEQVNTQYRVFPTGQAVTVSVGTVSVNGQAIASPTGQVLTASLGNVSISAGGAISTQVTGQSVTASVGTVSIVGKANATVTGQVLTVSVGTVTQQAGQTVNATGQAMTSAVGTAQWPLLVPVTGQVVSISTGTVDFSIDMQFVPVGLEMTMEMTGVIVPLWTKVIVPSAAWTRGTMP